MKPSHIDLVSVDNKYTQLLVIKKKLAFINIFFVIFSLTGQSIEIDFYLQ